jgi:hypothetical protein
VSSYRQQLPPLGAGDEYDLVAPDPDKGNWDEKTQAWRLKRFLDMSFPVDQAEQLAGARVWTGDVERWLGAGCSHPLAYAIAI